MCSAKKLITSTYLTWCAILNALLVLLKKYSVLFKKVRLNALVQLFLLLLRLVVKN